jgi:hypothetical protein
MKTEFLPAAQLGRKLSKILKGYPNGPAKSPEIVRCDLFETIEIRCINYSLHVSKSAEFLFNQILSEQEDQAHDLLVSDIIPAVIGNMECHDFIWFLQISGQNVILLLGGDWPGGRTIECRHADIRGEWPRNLRMNMERSKLTPFSSYVYNEFLMSKSGLALSSDCQFFDGDEFKLKKIRGLFVRVGSCLAWPLYIPFDHMIEYPQVPYNFFNRYRYIDWIISTKNWSEVLYDRWRINNALKNRTDALAKTRFIINHNYKHWLEPGEKCNIQMREGVNLLMQIDKWFKADGFEIMEFNPNLDRTKKLLENRCVRFIFANFHTVNRKWTTCDETAIDLSAYAANKGLSHIDLMTVSHCESFRPEGQQEIGQSICHQLLTAGVVRTGGSMVLEDAQTYLCKILRIFVDPEAFGPLLQEACILAGGDFEAFVKETNSYFKKMGYPSVCPDAMQN